MRRLPCSLFIYFLHCWHKDLFFQVEIYIYIYLRGKEFGLARNQLSRGCETDPVLDSCWESRSAASLRILQGCCSSGSCLLHLENRCSSTWNASAEKKKDLVLNTFLDKYNYRVTCVMVQAVLWNVGQADLVFASAECISHARNPLRVPFFPSGLKSFLLGLGFCPELDLRGWVSPQKGTLSQGQHLGTRGVNVPCSPHPSLELQWCYEQLLLAQTHPRALPHSPYQLS